MSLPVSHSLAGAAIDSVADADGRLGEWRRLLLAVALANAPGLDLVPGLIRGDPNRFHHGATLNRPRDPLSAPVASGDLGSDIEQRRRLRD